MTIRTRAYDERKGGGAWRARWAMGIALAAVCGAILAAQLGPPTPAALGQTLGGQERKVADGLSVETIRQITVALADKEMEGRGTGQPGGHKAAQYIGERMAKIGLKPLGDQGSHLQAFSCKAMYSGEPSTTHNVVGLIEGADPRLASEAVVFSAHYDGLGKDRDGRIRPGACDNAMGVAKILAIAEAVLRSPERPRRSLIFLAPTGEEIGFLGSRHWIQYPTWPIERIAADLNIDQIDTETYGPLVGIFCIGLGESNVDSTIAAVAADMQLLIVPDFDFKSRYFYRSDHYQFALAGVPTMFVGGIGVGPRETNTKPTTGGLLGALMGLDPTAQQLLAVKSRAEQFLANDYHRESDIVRPEWDWQGVRTAAVFHLIVGLRVANADEMPAWRPTSSLNRPRGTPAASASQ